LPLPERWEYDVFEAIGVAQNPSVTMMDGRCSPAVAHSGRYTLMAASLSGPNGVPDQVS
jgi:hypothetical protein